MLKITKKGDKYWLFEDSEIGLFSPSKFTINLLNNDITIVYENGLKSKRYNVSDCEIYDLGELTPFTTSSGNDFMAKLEELNCPCFQKNENIYYISGGSWSELTDFDLLPDATTPLSGTEEIPIVQSGVTKKVVVSEIGGGTTPTLQQVTNIGSTTTNDITITSVDSQSEVYAFTILIRNLLNGYNSGFQSDHLFLSDIDYDTNIYSRERTQSTDYYFEDEGGEKSIATREWVNAKIYDIIKLGVTTNATPTDGDVWLESNTNTGLKIRINGVTKTINLS